MTSSPHEPMPEGHEAPPQGVRKAAVVRWAILAMVALAAVYSVVVSLRPSASAQQVVHYTCPMHPQIDLDHPGDCPICGMRLQPRAAPPHDRPSALPGLSTVTLPLDRIQTSGIRTTRAVRKSLEVTVHATGVVAPDDRRFAEVTARVPGWLTTRRGVTVGDRVRRGQVLATIDSPDVLAASRELVSVRGLGGVQALAGADLGAPVRQRLELLGVPAAAIERMQASGRASGTVAIAAPIEGNVIARGAVPGSWVDRGTPLYQVADLSTVWVLAELYPQDVAGVAVGQDADVQIEGGAPLAHGRVAFLYPTTDPSTRTTKVRVELANPDGRIRPGLYAQVDLRTPPASGVVVPIEAVTDTGNERYVFVAQGGGHFEPRAVRLGPRTAHEVVIEQGLEEGEDVVSSSTFLLDSESRLRAGSEGSMPPMPGMDHGGHTPSGAPQDAP
jgi:membrane fusion protein, copper/silver efflux system